MTPLVSLELFGISQMFFSSINLLINAYVNIANRLSDISGIRYYGRCCVLVDTRRCTADAKVRSDWRGKYFFCDAHQILYHLEHEKYHFLKNLDRYKEKNGRIIVNLFEYCAIAENEQRPKFSKRYNLATDWGHKKRLENIRAFFSGRFFVENGIIREINSVAREQQITEQTVPCTVNIQYQLQDDLNESLKRRIRYLCNKKFEDFNQSFL
jgi:hypothetical protein